MIKMKKTIVITGSSRGIGRALAYKFLSKGHNVVINGTNSKNLEQIEKDFIKFKNNMLIIEANIIKDAKKIIEESNKRFLDIDIWINNAGIDQEKESFFKIKDDDIDKLININLISVIKSTKYIYNYMNKKEDDKIRQIFNMEGFGSDGMIRNNMSLYGCSKISLTYFTKSIFLENKNDKILISRLSPGMVYTDLLLKSIKEAKEINNKKALKIFSILADSPENVVEFFYKKIINNKKNNNRIAYLTIFKILLRFLTSNFIKREIPDYE